MLAGSEGLGGIEFDDASAAMVAGSVALALILFDGGLRTDLGTMSRRVISGGAVLSTVGVVVTAVAVGLGAVLLLGVEWPVALLLGAIISSTDAAAVFTVLRSKGIGISTDLKRLLEFESGSNDPTAVFLTTSVLAYMSLPDLSPWMLAGQFVYRIVGGALIGWLLGRTLVWLLNHVGLEHDGLYPVLTLASAGVTFGLGEVAGTSGFMAAYVAGLAMADKVFVHRNSLLRFHDGIAWVMQIAMFLLLGLLVFPSHLVGSAGAGVVIAATLVFFARPAAVMLGLSFSGFSVAEKLFVSWVGLRGAAPIVLATFPVVAGVPESEWLFNVVFFTVLVSVLVQGPSVGFVARRLGVAVEPEPEMRAPLELTDVEDVGVQIHRIVIPENSRHAGDKLLTIGGPSRPLVVMLRRGDGVFVPTGSTVLEEHDELYCLGVPETIAEMRAVVEEPGSSA